jgi:site-specific recombinase XerD
MGRWGLFDVAVWHTVLSSIAPSTKSGYEKIFFEFVSFFDSRGLDFETISIDVVLSFLQKFVGLSSSRIKTAVAALKFYLKIYKRVDLLENPLLDLFARGAKNKAPLPREKSDIWNPETVLAWLKTQPIPSSFLACGREAILLILLATGWRVDDVWKLSTRLIVSEEDVTCFFAEKRKCRIRGTFTISQKIGRFDECVRVCPVRALIRFRDRALAIRKEKTFLFISSTGLRASKDTLRKWVQILLEKAGIHASAGSCRSASTSAACEKKRSIDDILKSAGWSSENTFRTFYHRKVLPIQRPLNLMDS